MHIKLVEHQYLKKKTGCQYLQCNYNMYNGYSDDIKRGAGAAMTVYCANYLLF